MAIIVTVAIIMGTWIGVTNHNHHPTQTTSVAADVAAVSPPSSDIYINDTNTNANPIVNNNTDTNSNTSNTNNTTKPTTPTSTNVDTSNKKKWPELYQTDGEIAKAVIQSERPDLKYVDIVPDDSIVTSDYDTSRVRIFVNSDGIVTSIPKIG
jgi:hypothetical protein